MFCVLEKTIQKHIRITNANIYANTNDKNMKTLCGKNEQVHLYDKYKYVYKYE